MSYSLKVCYNVLWLMILGQSAFVPSHIMMDLSLHFENMLSASIVVQLVLVYTVIYCINV